MPLRICLLGCLVVASLPEVTGGMGWVCRVGSLLQNVAFHVSSDGYLLYCLGAGGAGSGCNVQDGNGTCLFCA